MTADAAIAVAHHCTHKSIRVLAHARTYKTHTHTHIYVAYVMTIPLQAEECRIQSTFERDVQPNVPRAHTYTHTHVHIMLDLGNVTSRASMTDVTSHGDFLGKHIHTRK